MGRQSESYTRWVFHERALWDTASLLGRLGLLVYRNTVSLYYALSFEQVVVVRYH